MGKIKLVGYFVQIHQSARLSFRDFLDRKKLFSLILLYPAFSQK
jgi:hypothetical protein